ncbi:odorant receptor 4-like [Phlebotomus argentipes]|uniref:odorant receptor 4-like n=1 Tax=Phlebotomus argentipes TaxID=94469 RepID=UPI00289339F5|nr:odorant receptor 4-like [Phlebotomus argentipes]
MNQVQLEREYRRYYAFLKSIISAMRLEFIPVPWFPVRIARMSIFPVISSLNFVALLWLLVISFKEGDMVTFSYGAIWISATLQSVVKALTAIYYKDTYMECFEATQTLVRRRFDESVEENVKIILKNSIKLTKMIVSAQGFLFHTTAFMLAFYAISTQRIYPLMYHIPFLSPTVNHIFQWFGVLLDLYTVLGGDFLFITMALHFRGELAIISEILSHLASSQLLRTVHQMHRDALRKLRAFQKIYYYLTFLQMISSFFLICLTTFMIRFHDIQMWAYAVLVCALMQIFFLCLIGDILFERASLISTALYLTKWYEMDLVDQQRILIMIAMAQKPYGIKAAGLVDISFFTFIEIIKLSVSYCAILFTLV